MPDSSLAEADASRILKEWQEIHWWEAFLVLALGLLLALAIKWLVPWLARRLPDQFRLWILPWEPILRVAVLLTVFAYVIRLVIHPTPQNLLAISGTLAVLLGFAFKDYASSLIAGVVALYERPYRNGDWIRIEETYGEVRSLNLRTVQIVTPDDTVVAIPHNKMWTTAILNSNNGQRELMCVADFYLHPDHDGRVVRQRLRDVALASPFLQIRKPILIVAAEKPWGTQYRLRAYPIDGRDQFQFITDLTLRGKAMLRRLGIKPALATAAVDAEPSE